MLRGVVIVLVLLEGIASADPLARARAALDVSDYLQARAELAAALESGACGPEDAAALYLMSGRVEGALGNTQTATDAFIRLLALSPEAALPPGTSPKIARPFDAAVDYFQSHARLEVRIETTSRPTLTVLVRDPVGMVAKLRVVSAVDGGAEQSKELAAAERTEVALPTGLRIEVRVSALDAHGNRLIDLGAREPIVILGELPAAPATPLPPVAVRADRPIYVRWWPYAAATVVFGGATAYFGWSAHARALELQDASSSTEAAAISERGRRDTLFTNIGFGVTGACAIATGAMYLLRPREVETRVTAVPVRGGGAVVVGGTF